MMPQKRQRDVEVGSKLRNLLPLVFFSSSSVSDSVTV